MRKSYDTAEFKFTETYQLAVQKHLFEEQLTSKAWLCKLYFDRGEIHRAAVILNELRPNIEYVLAKVPALGENLAKR
jgi:hypothetical protein